MTGLKPLLHDIRETYTDTYRTMRWIWRDILSSRGRAYATRALWVLMIAMFTVMSTSYILKEIIDALSDDRRDDALMLLLFGVGGVYLATNFFMALHEFYRELSWNDNYRSVVTNLSKMFFSRTLGELIAEDSEMGAEQIESAKDRVQNLLYLVLFESSQVLATIFAATVLMTIVDFVAAACTVVLIAFNIVWFLYFNTIIDNRMTEIDTEFRRANRRMVEKWGLVSSVKTSGAEDKTVGEIETEVSKPLLEDKKLWAYWFRRVDFCRLTINTIAVLGILAYGITISDWSVGDFAAIFAWQALIMEKFGFIGHLMRHATSSVSRIKAAREALTKQPNFLYHDGIIYERKV